MMLDVRTLVFVLLVCAILMSATLALDLGRGRAAGLGRWNVGLGLFAAGWMLIALRGVVPPVIGIALANALLVAGLCSQYAALREFGGHAVPRWLPVGPAAATFALLLPLLGDYAALTLAISLTYAAAFIALARATVRLGAAAGPVRWLSAGILLAASLAVVARALDVWIHDSPGMFTTSPLHGLAFIMLLAVTVTASFAFLVMQRRAAEERLRHLAMYDPLTELHNRRAFRESAERELSRAARTGSTTAALMLDLDHFKRVNDRHGHAAGDRVLADFAARLRAALRAGDLAGRYGGEEFCVLLPGTSLEAACMVAERVRAAVAAGPMGSLPDIVTVSIGAAQCAGSGSSIDALLAIADGALYWAKAGGRNRVVRASGPTPVALAA